MLNRKHARDLGPLHRARAAAARSRSRAFILGVLVRRARRLECPAALPTSHSPHPNHYTPLPTPHSLPRTPHLSRMHPPPRPVVPHLLLPDGHVGLEGVDEPPAGVER